MEVKKPREKKAVSIETFIFLAILIAFFWYFSRVTGNTSLMFKILMNTSYDLLINTCFFIMAISVLAGALGRLFTEYGLVSVLNTLLSVLMRPLFRLPGAAAVGMITTYLSDNPAIIPLAHDYKFARFFKEHELPALTNLGTSFGMGLILSTFMISINSNFILPVVIGNIGSVIGAIVSVRIMLTFTRKYYNVPKPERISVSMLKTEFKENYSTPREISDGSGFERFLNAVLEGGKMGVDMGLSIIPGVLFFCTLVSVLTFGPSIDPVTHAEKYMGVAGEGIRLLPKIGGLISPVTNFLFGFTSPEAISFPITSLGAVGAAMGLVPTLFKDGKITANDIAVFTAMGMCWSGYLSTHVGMMDALNRRFLTSKAIISHTIGGLCAGISAHFIYLLITSL